VSLPCGKCGITLSGKAHLDQSKGTTHFEFSNAENISEADPEFYLEISSELVTDKLRSYSGGPFTWSPPPFFQGIWGMGQERYAAFKERTLQFLHLVQHDWPTVKRINELWLNGQHQYLQDEIGRYLPKRQFPVDNAMEYLRGVHQVNLIFLWPILNHKRFERSSGLMFRMLPQLADKNSGGLNGLSQFFEGEGLLQRYDLKLLTCIENFVNKFRYLIPAFSLQFYTKRPESLLAKKGITTASFEDVKHLYAEMFEVATEVLPLAIAYNNLHHRGAFDVMKPSRKDVSTLQDFLTKSKGDRLQFLTGQEEFDCILFPHLDNKLRNAIAHASYRVNGPKQLISFFPSGVEGKGTVRRVYLLAFIQQCWSLFFSIVDLMEVVYQARKVYYIGTKGHKPIDPRAFANPSG
jgi:hypothetical protein